MTLSLASLKSSMADGLAVHAGCAQRGFVHHVGQVGAGESRCSAGQNVQVDIVGERNLLGMNAKHLFAAANVGTAHHYAAVETAGTKQRRIEHVGPVRRGDENDAVVRLEAVHLDQQLVQCLLALIVSAAQDRRRDGGRQRRFRR